MTGKPSIWREEIRRATNPKRLGALFFLSAIILFAGWNSLQRRVPFERSFTDNWYGVYTDSFYLQLIALSGTTVEPMKKIRYIVPGRKVNVIRWKLDTLFDSLYLDALRFDYCCISSLYEIAWNGDMSHKTRLM